MSLLKVMPSLSILPPHGMSLVLQGAWWWWWVHGWIQAGWVHGSAPQGAGVRGQHGMPKHPGQGSPHLVVLLHRRPNAEQTLEHPWFKVSLGSTWGQQGPSELSAGSV